MPVLLQLPVFISVNAIDGADIFGGGGVGGGACSVIGCVVVLFNAACVVLF